MYNSFLWSIPYQFFYHLPVFKPQVEPIVKNQAQNNNQVLQTPAQIIKNPNKKKQVTLSEEDLLAEGYQVTKRPWTQDEDKKLKKYVNNIGYDWEKISILIPGRNPKMCYSRYRRLSIDAKFHWKKGDNDKILDLVQKYGHSWRDISLHFTKRTAKQIRQHYLNFLRPNIQKKEWTIEEDLKILDLVNIHGNKWKKFEHLFEGRTQNQIKNRYYGRLKKIMQKKQKKNRKIKQ